MMHPWHSHGYTQTVVARDGYPLGRGRVRLRHARRRIPASAGTSNITADRLGHLGVPLPHPAPRRGPRRHVRHGQRRSSSCPSKADVDAIVEASSRSRGRRSDQTTTAVTRAASAPARSAAGRPSPDEAPARHRPVRRRRAATDQAFDLAARLGAPLLVVSVIDPGSLLLPGGRFRARSTRCESGTCSGRRRSSSAAASGARRRRSSSGTGDPGEPIVEAAEAERWT